MDSRGVGHVLGLGSTSDVRWWDQGTREDPTQPLTLTLINPNPNANPDPKRARNGPETRVGRVRLVLGMFRTADHDFRPDTNSDL